MYQTTIFTDMPQQSNVALNRRPRALSLFTGAGGLDIGFHNAGFDIVACIEIEQIFCETLKQNRGRYYSEDCKIINADIREIDPATLTIEPIDIIVGGPPCQSFSAAGRRAGGAAGMLDERGSLFEHYCRFVNHFRPRAFIFENVRGILQVNKGQDWQAILNTFTPLGYSLFYKILDAADYGVPQHRERVILVGVENGYFLLPRPTHGPDSTDQNPYFTAGEAIADLQPPDEPIHEYGGKYGRLLQEIPPGMNYHYFTKEMGYSNPIFAWRSRFSDFLYKADPNKPVKTIVARLGKYSGPFHWKSRKFTFAEFKRLQTFPDDYEFAGPLNTQLRQLGNAVAPRFAEALALSLRWQLFEPKHSLELLPFNYRLSFDLRKSTKARHTRRERIAIEDRVQIIPLERTVLTLEPSQSVTHYFLYSSLKRRVPLQAEDNRLSEAFRFDFKLEHRTLFIEVSKGQHLPSPLSPALEYMLAFHKPISNNISDIVCCLWPTTGADIPIAWDAIELGLRTYSGYHSLMDIYGHFTEPHPIFTLTYSSRGLQSDPIANFAQYFSRFEHTMTELPAETLKDIMKKSESINFLECIHYLRQLRFDVRVHETNITIQPGMFRCCYPFSLSIDKQISISWKERKNGNQNLMV